MSNFFVYTDASYTRKSYSFQVQKLHHAHLILFTDQIKLFRCHTWLRFFFISSRASATMRPIFRKPSKSCSLRIIMKTTVLPRIYILPDCIMFIFVLLLACSMRVDSSHTEYMTNVISMS